MTVIQVEKHWSSKLDHVLEESVELWNVVRTKLQQEVLELPS